MGKEIVAGGAGERTSRMHGPGEGDVGWIQGSYFTAVYDIAERLETAETDGSWETVRETTYRARRAVGAGTVLLAVRLRFLDDLLHSVEMAPHPEDPDRSALVFMAEEFFANFRHEPDGQAIREREVAALTSRITELGRAVAERPADPALPPPGAQGPSATDLVRSAREIEARHDPKTGKWMLKATGHPTTEHEVLQDALEAGQAIALAAEASLEADAFATTGLSKEKWRFDRFGFERVSDRDDRIWPSANGWQARIGWVRLPETATAAEAEALLEATPHLPSERLHVLDQAYARTCHGWSGSQHGAALALEAAGMIEEVQNDAGTMWAITPKGVEALDADPRSVPTRVREVVYAQGAAISQDRTPADLRAEWNSWFGTDVHSGENSAGLLMALENEFELYEGQVQDDPCEIAVFAEGEFPNGTRLGRDFSIMLLSSWWSEDANSSSLFAKAVVESRQEMIDAFNAGRTHPAP